MSLELSVIDMRSILAARYPRAAIFVLDASYNVPTDAAFDAFRDEFAAHMREVCGDRWQEYFDCNRFAFEAFVFANRKHWLARYAGRGTAQGVGIGVVCFRQNPSDLTSGHCINWRIRPNKSLVEHEPQTRKDIELSRQQCETAWLVLC